MKLSTVSLISENVEKLLPHLLSDANGYLKKRKDQKAPLPYANINDQWIARAVDWALDADPRFVREKERGKPLNQIKTPFVRHILRWWLDPDAGNELILPEDIPIVVEMLTAYNVAKQRGPIPDLVSFTTWQDLVSTVLPFTQHKEHSEDYFSKMGLPLVFADGPWKMYKVDHWIQGAEFTIPKYKGQFEHKAMEGTIWCVKHKSSFATIYQLPHYLAVYKNRKFALINFPSQQFKNPDNSTVGSSRGVAGGGGGVGVAGVEGIAARRAMGQDFINRMIAAKPEFLVEIVLVDLSRGHPGDFTPYLEEHKEEVKRLLNTGEMRIYAERVPALIMFLAKKIGEWPDFPTWPTGLQAMYTAFCGQKYETDKMKSAISQLVADKGGRLLPLEKIIYQTKNIYAMSAYSRSMLSTWPKEDIYAVTKQYREMAENNLPLAVESIGKMTQETSWTSRILPASRWPYLEKLFLEVQQTSADERRIASYIMMYLKSVGWFRWPEVEPIIGKFDKFKMIYEDELSIQIAEPVEGQMPMDLVRLAVRKAAALSEEKEAIILQDLNAAIVYSTEIIGPWQELEDKLAQEGTPAQRRLYRRQVLFAPDDQLDDGTDGPV